MAGWWAWRAPKKPPRPLCWQPFEKIEFDDGYLNPEPTTTLTEKEKKKEKKTFVLHCQKIEKPLS